ncbi:DUF6884 domain-containing protein [Halocatena marina]|uniref:DUF6884 domain-containing protein n=1 Tax=Halocatena marina TaxID=2934937 RepID=UPI00200D7916|nr:DUF6884 domain-containing protein [Halocatena marina]
MRFYVPEWDDAVDAHYDFKHDELSSLNRQERELDYIWDIFERDTTPIDGVLISREQVEESKRKSNRLAQHGVYDDPVLSIPDWLPTISDCGAWGYKSLPFPPYGNAEMLEFYETLEVTIGVTIDHLVLGSGKDKGRLYLDERAFGEEFKKSDIPDHISDAVDLMIDEWPDEWPDYIDKYEPTIRNGTVEEIEQFAAEDFQGDLDTILTEFARDSRAVYRENDKEFRYKLTLQNAQEMYDLYESGDYPFRLMVAIQGWTPESYIEATEDVLNIGYDYLGIGGVAGSPIHEVRKIVKGVGKTVKAFEREYETRIDSHVFGFAKTDGFETVGRSGMASFDSASMLRSAWTGGKNYRLDKNDRYDAIRVRYPSYRDGLDMGIEKSLRGREVLVALRAYAAEGSIVDALEDWHQQTEPVLPATLEYLREHRHNDQFDASRLREIESIFRDHFEYGQELQANFSDNLRNKLIKLLRKDDPEDPVDVSEYEDLLETAERVFESFPRMTEILREEAASTSYEEIWTVVRDYAEWIGDDDLLEEYQETLKSRPWEKCDCPVCTENGVEVCIFRGNDRNRRRGFHNTRRFYDEFARELPKTLIVTPATASGNNYSSVEEYLSKKHSDFWRHVHDLPVAEIGMLNAGGVLEWWKATPSTISLGPEEMAANLKKQVGRYQRLYVHTPNGVLEDTVSTAVEDTDCELRCFERAKDLRETVLHDFGEDYSAGSDFLPCPPQIDVDDDLDILVIDQCSGVKEAPESAPVFDINELDGVSRKELLNQKNVPEIAARDLYTGRQQKYIKQAVRRLSSEGYNVTRYFISAGFGLVSENEALPPYEVTFNSMRVNEIRERSARLNIKEDVEKVLSEYDYDLVFFALGSDYYTSIDIDQMVQKIPPNRIGVVFNREIVDEQFDNIVSVPARTEDAKEHSTIVIGLKGRYLQNFARYLNNTGDLTPKKIEQLCRHVEEEPTQVAFEKY